MFKIIFITILFLVSCSPQVTQPIQTAASPPMPQKTLEVFNEDVVADVPPQPPQFWDVIDGRTKKAGIKRLRHAQLAVDDIEVRVWMGFGLTTLTGLVLKRSANKWTALSLTEDFKSNHWRYRRTPLREPKTGWNEAWTALLQNHILTLPDAESINCDGMLLDGFSYVVEVRNGKNYRTYAYGNPEHDRCPEANMMLQIANFIETNYSVKDSVH